MLVRLLFSYSADNRQFLQRLLERLAPCSSGGFPLF
jgi:hypothetical protein